MLSELVFLNGDAFFLTQFQLYGGDAVILELMSLMILMHFAAETFPLPVGGRTVTPRINAECTQTIDESISWWKTLQAFGR